MTFPKAAGRARDHGRASGAVPGSKCRTFCKDLASVPIPKFAIPCSTLSCELRNQRDTSKVMTLVPLLNPKLALGFAASVCELRVRGTSANVNAAPAHGAWIPYLHSVFALGSTVVCVRFRNN